MLCSRIPFFIFEHLPPSGKSQDGILASPCSYCILLFISSWLSPLPYIHFINFFLTVPKKTVLHLKYVTSNQRIDL